MAKSSNQAAEQIQTTAPRSTASATDAPTADVPDTKPIQRIPLVWRLVFLVFLVCFALMVLHEISSLIGKLFR